jgi:hypothetical protein
VTPALAIWVSSEGTQSLRIAGFSKKYKDPTKLPTKDVQVVVSIT